MRTALLIVDVQNYFLRKAPTTFLSSVIKECQKEYALKAFITFKNEPASNFITSLRWQDCAGEADAMIPSELAQFITKNNSFRRTAYSAFHKTGLNKYLTDNEVEKLVVCGIDTDACVLATAFSAFDYGYRVEIKPELTYSTGNLQSEALTILKRNLISRV